MAFPTQCPSKVQKTNKQNKNTLEFAVRVKIINKISIIVSQKSVNYFENHIETITNVNESQISLQIFLNVIISSSDNNCIVNNSTIVFFH